MGSGGGALLWTAGASLPCLIGRSPCQAQLVQDFRALRQAAQDMKLFEARPTFFALLLGHILAMEVLGWLIIYLLGPGWVPSALTALILAISQVTLALSCSPPKLSNGRRAWHMKTVWTRSLNE